MAGCMLAVRWGLANAMPPLSWIVPSLSIAILLVLAVFVTRLEWLYWRNMPDDDMLAPEDREPRSPTP